MSLWHRGESVGQTWFLLACIPEHLSLIRNIFSRQQQIRSLFLAFVCKWEPFLSWTPPCSSGVCEAHLQLASCSSWAFLDRLSRVERLNQSDPFLVIFWCQIRLTCTFKPNPYCHFCFNSYRFSFISFTLHLLLFYSWPFFINLTFWFADPYSYLCSFCSCCCFNHVCFQYP